MISPQLRNSRMKRQHTSVPVAKPLQLGLPLAFHSGGDRATIDMWLAQIRGRIQRGFPVILT